MKKFKYHDREIEIERVNFYFRDEPTLQEGIMVHDSTDVNSDGNAIFGNGWTLDSIEDSGDLESLFTSGDGTTYWCRNADGSYTIS